MSIDVMSPVRWAENRGAEQGRKIYTSRGESVGNVAELYGIARMWKRVTIGLYIVAVVFMVLPVGGALRYIGVVLWTVGLFPLICWIAQGFLFRKAVKNTTHQ